MGVIPLSPSPITCSRTFIQPNVVVESDGTPRIGGLGSAFVQSSSPAAWSEDPPELTRYSAPELVNPDAFGLSKAQITGSSDVYALGVLTYEVKHIGTPGSE